LNECSLYGDSLILNLHVGGYMDDGDPYGDFILYRDDRELSYYILYGMGWMMGGDLNLIGD